MRKIKNICTVLLLTSCLLVTGILPGYGYFSQFQAIELLNEIESVEEKEVTQLVTPAVQNVRIQSSSSNEDTDHSNAYHPIFISNTAKAAIRNTPRFIQFCSLLN